MFYPYFCLQAIFVFESPINPGNEKMGAFHTKHGDAVKDVAFSVDDCKAVFEAAVSRGAKVVRGLWEEHDEFGSVTFAQVKTYGDTVHTFIQHNNYNGIFLPGYKTPMNADRLVPCLPKAGPTQIREKR